MDNNEHKMKRGLKSRHVQMIALGASVGTAALPGLGTAAGGIAGGLIGATVLGIIGSYSGDLAEYVIDISELE